MTKIYLMRPTKYIVLLFFVFLFTSSCDDYLTIYPQNAQVRDEYWQSKQDVEAVIISGYFYLRDITINSLLPWGELRSGAIFDVYGSSLQNFQLKPTDESNSNWGPLYQIVNIANVVLENAESVQKYDDTYEVEEMNAHLFEAYFLRALSYFYIVRNWREAPLITKPYEDDSNSYKIEKASESELIALIKSDIRAALATGASKEYDTTWENKGRATPWALYALMADVCVWSEDYETAIEYSNFLLETNAPRKPTFLQSPTHASWFSMFNPGNSNESIFEIQWNYQEEQTNKLPYYFDNYGYVDHSYELSYQLLRDFNLEYAETLIEEKEAVRTMYGGYYVDDPLTFEIATRGYLWKYNGAQTLTDKRTSTYYDPNVIVYRVTEVMLLKAEALILRSNGGVEEDWQEAINLMNQVRKRSNLEELEYFSSLSEEDMLKLLLHERRIEFVGEGKSWYDILRFGRRNNNKYKDIFLIQSVLNYNEQASESWLRSVLSNDDAHFLPISEEEIKVNPLLIQNPYYN